MSIPPECDVTIGLQQISGNVFGGGLTRFALGPP